MHIFFVFRILNSLEECSKVEDGFIMYEVVEMIRKICETLEQFCTGEGIDGDKTVVINSLYTSIESSDYAGELGNEVII